MRLPVLNVVSAIGLLFIIAVHSTFVYSIEINGPGFSDWKVLDVELGTFLIVQGGRFVIPFFFLTVGFYFGQAIRRGMDPVTFLILYGRKLLWVLLTWNLIYAFLPPDFITDFRNKGVVAAIGDKLLWTYYFAIGNPWDFLFHGTLIHLWFLIACLAGLAVTSFFLKIGGSRYLIPFGFVLYLVGMLGGSYSGSPIGLSFPFHPPNPFFSTLFLAVGERLSRRHVSNKALALSMFAGGCALHFAEIVMLKKLYNYNALYHDFLLGTMVWGIGSFLLCLEYPDVGKDSILDRVGVYSLGIYVSHFLIIFALIPVVSPVTNIAAMAGVTVLILAVTYCLCRYLKRYRVFSALFS